MGERKRPPASGHRNDSGGMGSMSKKSVQTGVSRRTIMAAGLAGAGALAMPSILRAQDRSLKVGVYGGYFKDSFDEHLFPEFTQATGIAVESVAGPPGEARLRPEDGRGGK